MRKVIKIDEYQIGTHYAYAIEMSDPTGLDSCEQAWLCAFTERIKQVAAELAAENGSHFFTTWSIDFEDLNFANCEISKTWGGVVPLVVTLVCD